MLPYETVPLDVTLNNQLVKHFKGEKFGFCQVGPEKWLFPESFGRHGMNYQNMAIRKDDIFLVTFPRSGTTMTQELIWLLQNNLDYKKSSQVPLYERFPFLDVHLLINDLFAEELIRQNNQEVQKIIKAWTTPGYKWAESMTSPRYFKTHLPFPLLPTSLLDTCKAVYVARNPKDVAISYYYHNKLFKIHDFTGNFEEYWTYFKNDLVVYAPYWKHVEEAWSRKSNPNLFFIFYEDLTKDLKTVIRKLAIFLNKSISESEIDQLYDHLQIENFRKHMNVHSNVEIKGLTNNCSEGFFRSGATRDKSEFTENLQKDADDWLKTNLLRNNIPFPAL